MTHRKFQHTDEAARALLAAYHATSDGAYRTRLQAVRLYGLGYTPSQIVDIAGCPRSTLLFWCRSYITGGIKGKPPEHRVAFLNGRRPGGGGKGSRGRIILAASERALFDRKGCKGVPP